MDASGSIRSLPQALCCCALLAPSVLTGCASPGPVIASPEVRLERVELQKLDLYGQTFLLGFSVQNPNPFALPVAGVRYEIRLGEARFAGGETRSGFVVPPDATTRFSIRVKLDLMQSAPRFNTLVESGFERTMHYELNGSLSMNLRSVKPMPFAGSGLVRLGGL